MVKMGIHQQFTMKHYLFSLVTLPLFLFVATPAFADFQVSNVQFDHTTGHAQWDYTGYTAGNMDNETMNVVGGDAGSSTYTYSNGEHHCNGGTSGSGHCEATLNLTSGAFTCDVPMQVGTYGYNATVMTTLVENPDPACAPNPTPVPTSVPVSVDNCTISMAAIPLTNESEFYDGTFTVTNNSSSEDIKDITVAAYPDSNISLLSHTGWSFVDTGQAGHYFIRMHTDTNPITPHATQNFAMHYGTVGADHLTVQMGNTGPDSTQVCGLASVYFSSFTTPPNSAPTIQPFSGETISEGSSYSASGTFADATSTSWTATVDYGDGSAPQPLTLSGTNFSLSHVYKDNGSYTVTVSVTDNQGATGTGTAAVTVNNVAPTVGTVTVTPSPAHINSAVTASASFTDPGMLDTHTATWNWGDGITSTGTVTELNGSGSVSNTHTYTSFGTYTVTLTVTDKDNTAGTNSTSVTVVKQITALDPVTVWVSKNLGNVIKLDLKAEVYKDTTLVSSGELDSVTVGTSGNPTSHTIAFNTFSPLDFPSGSQLKVQVYARNACSGSILNSGSANLYYNSSAHDSRFGATIGTTASTYHLLDGFVLGTAAGTSDKSVSVAAGAKCSPFKSFGTWVITP